MLVEMELHKIIIDEKRQDQVIVLKEKNGERVLPIVIGVSEISAIKLKISGIVPARPMTHDLLVSVVSSLGAQLQKVLIDKLVDGTFYAKLTLLSVSGEEILIDARPSDSIALAVRVKAPVFVDEDVIKRAQHLTPEA
jgi:bifunctional DNase/RNase